MRPRAQAHEVDARRNVHTPLITTVPRHLARSRGEVSTYEHTKATSPHIVNTDLGVAGLEKLIPDRARAPKRAREARERQPHIRSRWSHRRGLCDALEETHIAVRGVVGLARSTDQDVIQAVVVPVSRRGDGRSKKVECRGTGDHAVALDCSCDAMTAIMSPTGANRAGSPGESCTSAWSDRAFVRAWVSRG